MANFFGQPGVYSQDQARRILHRQLIYIVGFMTVFLMLIGLLSAYYRYPWTTIPAALLTLLIIHALNKPFERKLDKLYKERLNYLLGREGEDLIAYYLSDLPDTWYVFNGIKLQGDFDLDHVVVGPGGLYYISTKNIRGLITTDQNGQVLHNNKPTDLLDKTLRQAMTLRERLVAVMGTDAYINAVLAAPFIWVDLKNPHKNVWVLHRGNLINILEGSVKRLSEEQVGAYVKALEMIAGTAQSVRDMAKKAGLPSITPNADRINDESLRQ
ncbi:MAG: NERD domain-containing protein [Firmicutes bacterium]|nr:NERD domain-containing protein [Bacillota bacterium]